MFVDLEDKYKNIINVIDIFAYARIAASTFGNAASTAGRGNDPVDNGHVFGHVYEERKISQQAHLIRLGGRKHLLLKRFSDILRLFHS